MTWAEFYLICFFVGFFLSLLSVLGTFHLHLGMIHFHTGHVHIGHMGHGGGGSPFLNFGTIVTFLAWFGGTGYLLTEHSAVWFVLALLISAGIGIAGAAVVFAIINKFAQHDRPLDPEDYRMEGMLGRLSSPIRTGGTGEMIFSQEGTRRSAPARSEDGIAIPNDTEVVVTRYEQGIAYVRRWDELSGAEEGSPGKESSTQA
jgi:membrane protein implicated in regulation of membrane protease activity